MADFELVDKTFVHWAVKREEARVNREEMGLPRDQWTDDPIIRTFRFCNVSREDDRGTRVVKELFRDPMAEADPVELFKALCLSRFFNLPGTLYELVEREAITDRRVDLEAVHTIAAERMARGDSTFSTAYMVGAPPGATFPPYEGQGKISYVCAVVAKVNMPKARTREGFVKELKKEHGFKDFMAGQIAADLAYTHVLADAPDHMTWAPFGPGAVRGMNLATGRPIDYRPTEAEYLAIGRAQLEALPEELVNDRKLTLHDVASNVNCESFKYLRIQRGGTGRRFK